MLRGLAKTKLPSRIASDWRYRPELLGTGLAALIVNFIDDLVVLFHLPLSHRLLSRDRPTQSIKLLPGH